MSGQEDFAARALQMLEQSADPSLDHDSRMRLNARAQVYATLAYAQPAQPADQAAASSSTATIGRLVLRGANTTDRMSLRYAAHNRMYELLLNELAFHTGVIEEALKIVATDGAL